MKPFFLRLKAAGKAASLHFLASLLIGCLAALVVLYLWYPHPYGQLSGGRNLFAILVAVDVVCGPLLTWVLFNPAKPRRELVLDMSLVVFIQLGALFYGLYTAYVARPIYLVHEVDRFRVISAPDYGDADVSEAINALPPALRPRLWGGPTTVGIRLPEDREKRKDVLFESMYGGRDYAQRPEYYVPYDAAYAQSQVRTARPLAVFVQRYPETADDSKTLSEKSGLDLTQLRFLPVLHKQDWVAVLNPGGDIVGFLPGDGFTIP